MNPVHENEAHGRLAAFKPDYGPLPDFSRIASRALDASREPSRLRSFAAFFRPFSTRAAVSLAAALAVALASLFLFRAKSDSDRLIRRVLEESRLLASEAFEEEPFFLVDRGVEDAITVKYLSSAE
jgi:hypothetical protein